MTRIVRSMLLAAASTLACAPAGGTTSSEASSSDGDGSTTAAPTSTSTSTAADTSDDGAGSSSTGATLPPDCSDYVGRATPEQTAMTPLADAEAELLAIEASGEIVAPPALHDRIAAELAAIRADAPGLADIEAWPSWWPSSIVVSLDEEGAAAQAAGTYHAWDCPNELYHVIAVEPRGLFGSITLRFAGLYDVQQVIEDYLVVEHVAHAEIDGVIGDGPDVCLSIADDLHTYVFDDARGDCPAGCTEHVYTGFTVAPDGTITALGSFDPALPMPAPAWFEAAEACTAWL